MAEHRQEQQPKERMITEKEYLERLHREIDLQRIHVFQHEIKHGFPIAGPRMAPEVTIRLLGGDLAKVQALVIKIERLILDFNEENMAVWPPVDPKASSTTEEKPIEQPRWP